MGAVFRFAGLIVCALGLMIWCCFVIGCLVFICLRFAWWFGVLVGGLVCVGFLVGCLSWLVFDFVWVWVSVWVSALLLLLLAAWFFGLLRFDII